MNIPRMGDIGKEQEEWEIEPLEIPDEIPVESEPIEEPAPV